MSRQGAARYDVPRDANNNAIIGDSRNDENVVISQLHLAMLRFHNAVVDHLRAKPALAGTSPERMFQMAQRLVRWHYQWIILHEFLPVTIGPDRVTDILRRGLRFYNVDDGALGDRLRNARRNPLIPIEFSTGAYRFGQSQVRPSYRLNFGPDGGSPFFAFRLTMPLTRTIPIRPTCGEAEGRPGDSSTGRRSLISTTATCARTRGSIPSCRAR